MDWSPFLSEELVPIHARNMWGKTTIYFMISPTINLQIVNFIEQFLAIQQGFSVAVCVHQNCIVHAHWSRTSGNFFFFSCLIHTHFHCSRKQLLLLEIVFTSSVHASGACLSQNTQNPDSDVWRFHTIATYTFYKIGFITNMLCPTYLLCAHTHVGTIDMLFILYKLTVYSIPYP